MFDNGESNKVASFAWTMEQYAYEIPGKLYFTKHIFSQKTQIFLHNPKILKSTKIDHAYLKHKKLHKATKVSAIRKI